MRIGYMCIGTEVLIGDTLNTNGNFLANLLSDVGLKLSYELSVSDDKDEIGASLNFFTSNVDVLIVSGGLGPTEDDMTKEYISKLTGISLIEDDHHTDWMVKRWKQRGLEMPDLNRKQSLIFKDFDGIPNNTGTALGAELHYKDTDVYLLPGPPREFKPMVEDYVINKIDRKSIDNNVDYKYITLYGIPESTLAESVNKLKPTDLDIAYLPKYGIVKLRYDLNKMSKSLEDDFLTKISNEYKNNIVSYSNESLEKTLYKKFSNLDLNLSLVESITGGNLSGRITSVAGSSKVLYFSKILYQNASKEQFLKTKSIPSDWRILSKLLSEEALKQTNTSVALAVLGEAGPIASTEYKVGEIFIAMSDMRRTEVERYMFMGNREDITKQTINQCLFDLIKWFD